MDERYIMAIDLGTSKIALTVAKIEGDNIQIIYDKDTPSDGIRYSRVHNPQRAGEAIRKAMDLAKEELGFECGQIVVGYPKYEVRQEAGSMSEPRNEDECVTKEDIQNLKALAMDTYPLKDPDTEVLLGAVAQSFNCGEDEFQIVEKDVIGMTTKELEGNFKLFVGQAKNVRDMDIAFKKAGNICVTRKYFTADATAKAVLYDSEMENGVALIDLGAGVTSVSIYYGNIMRHYAAIPFGGQSITSDIKSICAITEKLAENIKLAYGACMPDRLSGLGDKVLRISSGSALPYKDLKVQDLSQIITARATEIIEAVLYEIQKSGCAEFLRCGIVVTGGGANLANITTLIKELSGYSVRVGYPKHLFAGADDYETCEAASIGMILMAKEDRGLNGTAVVEKKVDPVEVEEPEDDGENVFSGADENNETGEERNDKPAEPKKPRKKKEPKAKPKWKFGETVFGILGDIMDEKA
ncbi:MAG: cell division protein FtsA [Bacteroidales bacterium]|nr:cell division protein FtsA [Bacteroidales bacterium]